MKNARRIALSILLIGLAACRVRTPAAATLVTGGPYATLQLEPQRLKDSQEELNPLTFVLKNTSTNELSVTASWTHAGYGMSRIPVGLMTTDGTGKPVPLDPNDECGNPNVFTYFAYFSVARRSQMLNPGASVSAQGYLFSRDGLDKAAEKGRKVFGQLPVMIAGTGWMYLVRSAPFELQPDLAQEPGRYVGKITVYPDTPQNAEPVRDESPVTLDADLQNGTLTQGGWGMVPFVLKNTSTNEISFVASWTPVLLTTTNSSGKPVTLDELKNPDIPPILSNDGIRPRPQNLKSGESVKLQASFSMDTLAYAARKGRKVFGQLPVMIIGTDWMYMAQSNPVNIPPELTEPPWEDEGKEPYLTVTVDESMRRLSSPVQGNGSRLYFRVNIKNTSSQTCVVNSEHVSFLKSETDREDAPNLWDTFAGIKPIPGPSDPRFPGTTVLKPGDSVHEGQESYITVWINTPATHWHAGDTVVAAVAGRIEGTNKGFESYSAPFKFPDISHMPYNDVPFDNPEYEQK
jgi:hypothetical protein